MAYLVLRLSFLARQEPSQEWEVYHSGSDTGGQMECMFFLSMAHFFWISGFSFPRTVAEMFIL